VGSWENTIFSALKLHFLNQEEKFHILIFEFSNSAIISTTPQEPVREARIESGTAALQSVAAQWT
jgi:hypothetical protein